MSSKIKSASVKVMLHYDYSYFEASMSLGNDDGISIEEIDNARKSCQRLSDKAVAQYKVSNQKAASHTDNLHKIENFKNQCEKILKKEEGDRTINEIAMIKQYQQDNWESQFYDEYDYDDDDKYKL